MTQQSLWQKFIQGAKLPLELAGLFIAVILILRDVGDVVIPFLIPPKIDNSIGEKTMFPAGEISPEKELGMREIKEKRFSSAISYFRQSLNSGKKDPETVIFLNNSIAQAKKINQTRKILEIAVSIPAGGESNVAAEILRGVGQAQSEFNCGLAEISLAIKDIQHQLNCQGSLNGNFLQVTIVDDKYQPETAKKIAEYLVKQKEIIAVIGHYSSSMTLSAGEIYNKHKLVGISPTSTSTILWNFSKFVFKIPPSDKAAAQVLFEYFQKISKSQKVAVAYVEDNPYSESLKREFETLLLTQKNEFVHECYLNSGNFSAQDCIGQAQKQGAEVMLLFPVSDITLLNAILIIENAQGLNLIGGDSIYNYRVVNDAGEEANQNNLTVAIPWHRDSNKKFAQKSKKFWNGEINWRTATTYDTAKTIIKALEKSNGHYSRQKLQRILSSPDFSVEGVTGKIRFGELGDRQFEDKDKSVLV